MVGVADVFHCSLHGNFYSPKHVHAALVANLLKLHGLFVDVSFDGDGDFHLVRLAYALTSANDLIRKSPASYSRFQGRLNSKHWVFPPTLISLKFSPWSSMNNLMSSPSKISPLDPP